MLFVRAGRIELPTQLWKSRVLPLNYARFGFENTTFQSKPLLWDLVGAPRFELELNPPKGLVLPLHYAPPGHPNRFPGRTHPAGVTVYMLHVLVRIRTLRESI